MTFLCHLLKKKKERKKNAHSVVFFNELEGFKTTKKQVVGDQKWAADASACRDF